MKIKLKTKASIARVLQIIFFGIFSCWYCHRYSVDIISIEYGFFFFGVMITSLLYCWEEVLKKKIDDEEKDVLKIVEKVSRKEKLGKDEIYKLFKNINEKA